MESIVTQLCSSNAGSIEHFIISYFPCHCFVAADFKVGFHSKTDLPPLWFIMKDWAVKRLEKQRERWEQDEIRPGCCSKDLVLTCSTCPTRCASREELLCTPFKYHFQLFMDVCDIVTKDFEVQCLMYTHLD